jgi:hypothetical protein
MSVDKIFYNQMSSKQLGWTPDWFGAEHFDEDLIKQIKKWQRNRKLKMDGLVSGPNEKHQLMTSYQKKFQPATVHTLSATPISFQSSGTKLSCGQKRAGSPATQAPTMTLQGSHNETLRCLSTTGTYATYYDFAGKPQRDVKMFVNHWDVCLSSKSCERIMKKLSPLLH